MEGASFSYKRFFGGDTLMVVVPHEDDEVNLAGAVIYGARQEGMRVVCVFVTNGDNEFPGSLRIGEAVQALQALGVPEEDSIFLGYPDGGAHGEHSLLLYGRGEAMTVRGHGETYGTRNHPDFSFQERGYHQPYRWDSLLSDLEAVILKYHPAALIGTDFDSHADHRMVSLAFDKAMGKILNEAKNYHPLVLKGFCYATSYGSVKDFYSMHLLSTAIRHNAHWREGQTTDTPCYAWERRVRLPVVKECRGLLMGNPIFHALLAHVSQKGHRRAKQVVNGDQVFWLRRTDNLLYDGRVSVSSGTPEVLHDFLLWDTEDIGAKVPTVSPGYLWQPEMNDKNPWCRCDFDKPRHVERISLYGNVEEDSRILRGKLEFSNGFSAEVPPLGKLGQETVIDFPPQEDIQWIRFKVMETEGPRAGLSEWGIYKRRFGTVPFLKLCVNSEFAYDWTLYPGEKPSFGAYLYGAVGDIQWFANGIPVTLEEINQGKLDFSEPIRLRAQLSAKPDVYDEICVHGAGFPGLLRRETELEKDHVRYLLKNNHQRSLYHKLLQDVASGKYTAM